ncbi:hydroxypyruvate isomerase family protein [Chitinophaga vietnamensis]|uniref:hydroxypyruvate isomerase family protein n=1 Tax=Chitinophaga vietnamensis TaxID=2593957 RepID=UPI00117863A1|nr:TIM barrel protein [Chitinophaga vietnamensis]
MERRKFLQQGTLAGISAMALGGITGSAKAAAAAGSGLSEKPFQMNYAPHDGQFKNNGGASFLDQIKFMYDQGFRAIEDNGMLGRDAAEQEKIGNLLAQKGMTMGVFVVDTGNNWKTSLTTGKQEFKDAFLKTCRESVTVAKRTNAKWMTVVPGFFDRSIPMGIQTAHVVDALRRGAEIFEPHGLVMVLEPLSDTPELFLRTAEQSFEVCKAVNSPSCKILYDIYHMQRNVGNLIPVLDMCYEEIAYIQIGDNPGRKEPGSGEINYRNIFKHLHQKGYKGVLGMEHGMTGQGKEGEIALIKAYRDADNF